MLFVASRRDVFDDRDVTSFLADLLPSPVLVLFSLFFFFSPPFRFSYFIHTKVSVVSTPPPHFPRSWFSRSVRQNTLFEGRGQFYRPVCSLPCGGSSSDGWSIIFYFPPLFRTGLIYGNTRSDLVFMFFFFALAPFFVLHRRFLSSIPDFFHDPPSY